MRALEALFTANMNNKTDRLAAISEFFVTGSYSEKFILRKYLDPLVVTGFSEASYDSVVPDYRYQSIVNTYTIESLYSVVTDEFSDYAYKKKAVAELKGAFTGPIMCGIIKTLCTKGTSGVTVGRVNELFKKVYGKDFIDVFQCQLANKANLSKLKGSYYVSTKLDGFRAVYHRGSSSLLSSGNKPLKGFEHIEKECSALCGLLGLDFLDGELYAGVDVRFEELSSRIKNPAKDKTGIRYYLFACDGKEISTTTEMIGKLAECQNYLNVWRSTNMLVLLQEMRKATEISSIASEAVGLGFEGLILRDVDQHYDFKRSDALLKWKPFKEDVFTIVDYFMGKGRLEGLLGGFVVEKEGVRAEVGSGFTDAERYKFLVNVDYYIGRQMEVKYFSLTDTGVSLRHPVYLKML